MVEPLAPATFFYTGIVGAQDFIDGKAKEISGFKVVDDYTVEITLEKPEGSFLMAMTMPFTSVMPKEWVKKVGKDIKRKPLGTGPYVITDWTPGQSITAEKNTNWTGDTSQWVDDMKFVFTANPSTALLQLERGEVDVLGDGVPAADYNRTKRPELEQVHRRRLGDRHVLRVHERAREAVHRPQGAAGGQLRDQHGAHPEAARRAGQGAEPDLSGRHARLPGGQAVLHVRPGEGEAAARGGRLPQRVQGDVRLAQRRPDAQAGAGGAERPQGSGHRRQHQADGQGHLLGLHQPVGSRTRPSG